MAESGRVNEYFSQFIIYFLRVVSDDAVIGAGGPRFLSSSM